MKALLVHGAGASPVCWRTFRRDTRLETEVVAYDVQESFPDIIRKTGEIAKEFDPDVIVGHSFGGVVAWHLANEYGRCGVSIASPWGGSVYCDLVELVTVGALAPSFFRNVSRYSSHLITPRTRPVPVPWMNIVTTRPGIHQYVPNDGVVTVDSQTSLYTDERLITCQLPYSHGEVLHTDELPEYVETFAKNVLRSRC